MSQDVKKKDDMRPIGAIICGCAGLYLIGLYFSSGELWRLLGGALALCFGIVRFWQLK